MCCRYAHGEGEEGSVLLIALVVLFLVALLGVNALTTTQTELKISGNDQSYTRNFYRAESAIKEAALALEHADDVDPATAGLSWLSDGINEETCFKPEQDAWQTSGSDTNAAVSTFYTDGKAAFCGLRMGVASGSSLDMTSPLKWEYVIYGRSVLSSGKVEMAAGYCKKTN
ncbi:PilX N-terminal domain-containing pilus assembly protein [Desulfoluna butyratoxydans]|uniref:Type 4 fimbrial biogenesis protein pilx n-terminal domain n=1 Tax=Desulfoluna butyratoxydans TaxID=231438 RepID=A0A4U8YPG9_9BACT|nr:PilX N-terminal domain-containing pilus assembly protein [Desulfoluna butyratoxydans]VFQ45129.1 type 4 fimbrial biogenesis protein pilx n-terminal domain [Desulfoluna butyratoxydans]